MPPTFVRPCIPTTAKAIPRGDDWVHEPKLDGYRVQIVKSDRQVRLYRRTGLAEALAGIRCQSAVIDGELVFPTSAGNPDFYRLQAAMASDRQHELAVFAFDLMYYDGEDIRPLHLIERRLQLTELVARSDIHCLHLIQAFD